MYMAQMIAAGLLIVIDVLTSPSGMPAKSNSMSARELIATPHLPNSPSASSASVSYPYKVGMSKATDRPVLPWLSR